MRHNLRNSSIARRLALLAGCGFVIAATGGCAMIPTIQRKFTRKTYHPPPAVAITTKNYELNLSPEERYKRHWAMWAFWNDELLDGLGASRKRTLRAAEESIQELTTLQNFLAPETGAGLAAHIMLLERLRTEADKDLLSGQSISRWRSDVERQKRYIQRQFTWSDVQEHLKPTQQTPPPPLPDVPIAREQ